MKQTTITITGRSPLLMHSDTLANPLHPLKKEIAAYTSKRKKTDDDHEMIAYLEWKAGMYHDSETGPYLPGRMVKAALIRAATKTKEGPKVRSGLIILNDKNRLEYTGPRDIDKLWKDGKYVDMRSVVVQRARTMRCRPVFHDWACTVTVAYDESVLDKADILRFFDTAGQLVGVGDYRPENGGDFGRFDAQEA